MISLFNNFEEFRDKARALGVISDLNQLLSLEAPFLKSYDQCVIVSVKDFYPKVNNLLILTKETNLYYSEKQLQEKNLALYEYTVKKPFGESTALALIVMNEILENYSQAFEKINVDIDSFSSVKDLPQMEKTNNDLRKLTDRIEDFVNILIELEDRKIREVRTNYVNYDYDVLLAKARHLLDRSRNHVSQMRDVRNEMELKNATELNKRIENLTNIMKKLTALTLILMIPNIVTSYFGMNFKFMPELAIDWAYPAVILSMLALTTAAVFYFKKRGWL